MAGLQLPLFSFSFSFRTRGHIQRNGHLSSVNFHKNFFWHDESFSLNLLHNVVDIFPFVQNVSEVEVVAVDESRLLESVSKGQSDEGDELVGGPGGVVCELLLLETNVRTSRNERKFLK